MTDYDQDPFAEKPKAKSISWADAPDGAEITLKLTGPAGKPVQKREYDDPDVLMWWDKEKTQPKMQVVLNGYLVAGDLGTGDELRALWFDIPSSGFSAVKAAQTKAGVRLDKDGLLTVRLTGRKKNPDKPRLKPANQFGASYEPPAASDPWASDAGVNGSSAGTDEPPF